MGKTGCFFYEELLWRCNTPPRHVVGAHGKLNGLVRAEEAPLKKLMVEKLQLVLLSTVNMVKPIAMVSNY